MKSSELISILQQEIQQKGDNEVVFAANRHSYTNMKIVSSESRTTLALFEKIAD